MSENEFRPVEPVKLVPGKSDKEISEEFRARMIEVYQPVCDLCTEAEKLGFEIIVGSGRGALGTHQITQLQIIKRF